MFRMMRSLVPTLLVIGLLASGAAYAGPAVAINDFVDTLPEPLVTLFGVSPYGFDPATLSIQSSIAADGTEIFDLHGEWVSTSPLGAGAAAVVNFNFYEDSVTSGTLSDTLNLTFTGQQPTTADPNNVSLDMHFRSEGDPGTPLTPLAGGLNLTEFKWAAGQELSPFIVSGGGPGDISMQVFSVPEPSSIVMLGLGAAGLAVGVRRRRKSLPNATA